MEARQKECQNCALKFNLEAADLEFYNRFGVPQPTFCPECRLIRRLMFRNDRSLYKRKCDLCDEMKIMQYPEDAPFPVYCRPCWWSDNWNFNDEKYSREWDADRSFWEQFHDLMLVVPRAGTVHQGNIVNSDYTNRATDLNNCYLVFGTTLAEDCRYSTTINSSKNCVDCYNVKRSEHCYESVDCHQCYNLFYSQESNECSDSYFLYNCRNLQNCFGCVNLRNKQYCIWNQQYTKEEYEKIIQDYKLDNSLMLDGLRTKFEEFKKQFIVPWMVSRHNQNISGNWIGNSKNLKNSFVCEDIEDGAYNLAIFASKDVMDLSYWGAGSERVYECANVGIQSADVKFSSECWNQVIDVELSMNCHNSKNLLGCVGLRNAEYKILNKQYSKDDYFEMVERIKKSMNERPYVDSAGKTYIYGEFFPPFLSPHAYNESVAQEFFPLTQAEAKSRGYSWREEQGRDYKPTLASSNVPDSLEEVDDKILTEVIACGHSGECNHRCTAAFRIIPEELQFYRSKSVPLPKLCPNCRHFERLARRNPLKLWPRKCACAGPASVDGSYQNTAIAHPSHDSSQACPNEFETSFAPNASREVYCEPCYQAETV